MLGACGTLFVADTRLRRAKSAFHRDRRTAFVSVAVSSPKDFISITVTRLEHFAGGCAVLAIPGLE
jgi:hypothetical protein